MHHSPVTQYRYESNGTRCGAAFAKFLKKVLQLVRDIWQSLVEFGCVWVRTDTFKCIRMNIDTNREYRTARTETMQKNQHAAFTRIKPIVLGFVRIESGSNES